MNDQLEQDLATAFGEHAGGAVDTDVLAGAATRRGRRLRARTYAVRCAATAAVVAVVAAGAVSVYRSPTAPQPGGQATTSASASPGDLDWTLRPPPGGWAVPPPVVVDVPADPSKVGTDPSLLHFTVDGWTLDATYTTWRTTSGIETISFMRGKAVYRVSLARSIDLLNDMLTQQPLDGAAFRRWQPVAGVWAQVLHRGGTDAETEQIKARVRLDTTLRCTAPVQFSGLPAGARLLGCETTLAGTDLPGRLLLSTLWVGENTVDQAEVTVTRPHPAPSAGTLMLNGRPARVFTDDRFRPSVEFPDAGGLRILLAGTGTYKGPTLITIAEGLRVGPNGTDPAAWPHRIVAA